MFSRFKLNTVRILSIDGGGVRGIIPAYLLWRIETALRRRGKERAFSRMFHMVAGTSTGGLIALALTIPQGAPNAAYHRRSKALEVSRILDLYRNQATRIFPPKSNRPLGRMAHAVKHKYDGVELDLMLEELFGEKTLQEALTNVLITSYDTERREPRFFKKRPPAGRWADDLDFRAADVARATVAAPTYFHPAFVSASPSTGETFSLVDGGVFMNNPALGAYVEARKIYPNATRFIVVSLGTGIVDRPYPFAAVKEWGYLDWVSPYNGTPLLSMMMDGQSDSVVHMLKNLPGVTLYRFDPRIEERHSLMDDSSAQNISYLEERARNYCDREADMLEELARRL